MAKNDVRIAYILQVHKNPGQVNKFIRQIAEVRQSDIYIHVDKKSAGAVSQQILKGRNIKIMEESLDVAWGDISMVDATLLLLRNFKKLPEYDFVCLKSGQDLLVSTGIREYLAEHKNKIS